MIQLSLQHEHVSAAMIKEAYQGKKKERMTLLGAYDFVLSKIEKKSEMGQRTPGTLTKWRTTRSKIATFLEFSYRKPDISLDQVKYSFAEDFVDFLMLEQGMQNNSAMKYLKNTKHVLKTAEEREWISKNPITPFKCSYINPDRDLLDEAELLSLYNKRMPLERLEEVKDAYLFMCFTGYAYKDASLLKPSNLKTFYDGEEWIVKNREKTWCRENVPVLPVAKEIIERYKSHPYCREHGLLLPIKSNQKYNAYLNEVAIICGINKLLTTHTARHTFATTVTLANGVPLETVSALLGHKSIRTTQIYAKIVAQKISIGMNQLREKLDIKMPVSLQRNMLVSDPLLL